MTTKEKEILSIVAAVAVLVGGIVYADKYRERSETNLSSSRETDGDPDIKTFTSSHLGITFSYVQNADNPVQVKEIGDKVYVYYSRNNPESGQWIQVFSKDEEDSLETAIEKKFLVNYSQKDCFVKEARANVSDYPSSYSFAAISFPPIEAEASDLPYWANAEKCPKIYTTANGISGFMMDKDNPDRFFFYSIGQYAIFGDKNNHDWLSTLRILKATK